MARGALYIEYNRNKDGSPKEKPVFHDIASITVREGSDAVHGLVYQLDTGESLTFYFRHDKVEIIGSMLDGSQIISAERLFELIQILGPKSY